MSNVLEQPHYYIADCAALLRIATTKANSLKSAAFDMLSNGAIRVPTQVWDEFVDAYEDEADSIKQYVTRKIKNNAGYDAATASLVDKSNSGFRNDPYGNSDWTAGAVACQDRAKLFTHGADKVAFYKSVLACDVCDIDGVGKN